MLPSAAEASRIISEYRLPAVLVGTFFEGEAVLLAAGLLAARGLVSPLGVWLAASLGSWAGHLTWFSLARAAGAHAPLHAALRWPPLASRVARVDALVRRHPTASMVALQYLYGVRIAGALALGLTKLSWKRFLLTEAVNCLVWSALFTGTGYVAGSVAGRFMHGWPRWIWVALSLGIALEVLHRLSRRAADRLVPRDGQSVSREARRSDR